MSESHLRRTAASIKAKNARMAAMVQPYQDTMQVCLNGHKITGRYDRSPQNRKPYCNVCGKATTTECAHCHGKVPGYMWYPNVISSDDSKVPEFCPSCGEPYPWNRAEEDAFLAADFGNADAQSLAIDDPVKTVIQDRLKEAGDGLQANMPLSVVFSCGSAVEGMLFAYASNNQKLYNQATAAPKDQAGRVRPLSDWKLDNLINVAREVGHIGEDTKQFTQPLKNFRNYIHPREQVRAGFKPTLHTAQICYQVTKSVINDLEQV